MSECYICKQKCIVPVKMQCFECFDSMKMHCNALQRICMVCFLQGDLQKCSFCRAPRLHDAIEIDFLRMEQDCHSILSCPYCDKFQGSHFDLYHHMMKSCVYQCECKKWVVRKDQEQHVRHKCTVWKWCKECEKPIQQCKHFPCKTCHVHCSNTLECKQKKIQCSHCGQMLTTKTFLGHFLKHVDESKCRITTLKEILQKERLLYHELLLKVPAMYNDIYDESIFTDSVP